MATVISDKLTIDGAGAEVVLDGFDFTTNGYVEVKNASVVVIQNCRVYNMNLDGADKNYWLRIYNDIPVRLVVEHNFFGNHTGNKGDLGSSLPMLPRTVQMYNLIEPNAKLMQGSSISNNYFAADCCTHNIINVYGCDDGASVDISGNVIEETAGGIRIGVKGAPTCRINIRDNKVLAANPDYEDIYQGLVTLQPYGKQTTSFADMTVVMSGNELPVEQLAYAYCGSNDLTLTDDVMPKLIVNGKVSTFTIYQ